MNLGNPRVLFRTDAGKYVGTGHVMRSLALACGFRKAGAELLFLVNKQASELILKGENESIVEVLDSAETLRQTPSEKEKALIAKFQPDLIVLDGYHFSSAYRVVLAALGPIIMVIDDNNDIGPLYADIVLNTSLNAENFDYAATAPAARILAGPKYCLLRPEFEEAQGEDLLPQRNTLLLTFGGSDPKDLSSVAIGLLDEFFPPETEVLLVTGPLYENLENLDNLLRSTNVTVQHHHAVVSMAPLYRKARLAISAAGSAQFELAATRTPTLLAIVADNQKEAAARAAQEGFSRSFNFIGHDDKEEMRKMLRFASEVWLNNEELRAMAASAPKLARPGGALRAVEAVLTLLKTRFAL